MTLVERKRFKIARRLGDAFANQINVFACAEDGDVEMVKYCLNHGVSVNADRNYQSLLHLSAYYEQAEMVQFLISKGANILAKDRLNRFPLGLTYCDRESFQVLLPVTREAYWCKVIVGVALAFLSMRDVFLPVYVLLEIIDWFPMRSIPGYANITLDICNVPRIKKVRCIEMVHRVARRLRAKRKLKI